MLQCLIEKWRGPLFHAQCQIKLNLSSSEELFHDFAITSTSKEEYEAKLAHCVKRGSKWNKNVDCNIFFLVKKYPNEKISEIIWLSMEYIVISPLSNSS